ncbi:hypothetical protein NDU88_002403 [Pleurodeles waltl]|uniref:Uncharacterized protein n=1 Tax=Pleurodeles waltl TaxID=8319 RepID=A0AAV7W2A3_PLEWA|nr:hypothetical protein NDU88_002403 [Pleurodeles waltl]
MRLGRMNEHIDSQATQLDGAECCILEIEDESEDTKKRLEKAEQLFKVVAIKKKDLETRSCHKNICIAGIAESTNTCWMDTFVESLLTTLFGKESFTDTFVVKRADRTPCQRPVPSAPKAFIIVRRLNFHDRDSVFRLAREKGPLMHQGMTISLFPDYTQLVQEAHLNHYSRFVILMEPLKKWLEKKISLCGEMKKKVF